MDDELDARIERVVAVAAEHAEDVDRRARFPREALDALAREGLLGLTVAGELGGMGRRHADAYELISRLARADASAGMVLTMHYAALGVLSTAGAGRFDDLLREAAAGHHLATLALSERATRSNFWLSMGTSEPDGDGVRIDVEKSFVTSAGPATSYVVTVGSPGRGGVSESDLWLVRAEDQGVEVLDWWQGSGLRGNSSAPMRFRCRLDEQARVGEPGKGLELLLERVIPWFQLGAAAVSAGIAQASAAFAREHVLGARLEHIDQRLIDQPVVRHTLGRLLAQVDALDGFLRAVAAALEAGTARFEQVLEAKAVANEAALATTDLAMRLGGGAAYSGRAGMDRHFRDARAGVIMAPTADMLYEMIGRVAAGQFPLDLPD